jgi:hypothetical protein
MTLIEQACKGCGALPGEIHADDCPEYAALRRRNAAREQEDINLRRQLEGAVGSLRVIVAALEGFRDELGGSTQDRVATARHEAREALAALRGQQ